MSSWRREIVTPPAPLRGVWGDGRGGLWAVGGFGLVLRRASDGTWTPCKTRTRAQLGAIHGAGEKVYAGGWPHDLVLSSDGLTFAGRATGAKKQIHVVHALAGGRVLVVPQYERRVLSSDDGGRTWQSVPIPLAAPRSLAELADGSLWMTGDGSGLLRSTDGGASWQPHPLAGHPSLVVGRDRVLLVHVGKRLLRSDDGGASFEPVFETDTYLTGFAGSAGGPWVLVGYDGFVARSLDEGRSWATESAGIDRNLEAVWTDGVGFCAVGDDGIVLVSGTLTTSVPAPTPAPSPKKKRSAGAPAPRPAEPTLYAVGDLVAASATEPAGPRAHASEIRALAIRGERLVSGDASGRATVWRREAHRWHAEHERDLGAPSTGVAFAFDRAWASCDARVVDVVTGEARELGAPVLGLEARAHRLFAWCPPHVIELDAAGAVVGRVDTGATEGALDVSADGARWLIDGKARVWGDRTGVRGAAPRGLSRARWLGDRLIQARGDKYDLQWLAPGKATGKRAARTSHAAVVQVRTGLAVDGARARVAFVDLDGALHVVAPLSLVSSPPLAPEPAPLFSRYPLRDESLGGAPREVAHTTKVWSKHRIVSEVRAVEARAIALDGEVAAVGDVDGEIAAMDLATGAVARLGRPTTLAQPPCSAWTYRGTLSAFGRAGDELFALGQERVVIAAHLDTGAVRATAVRVDPALSLNRLVVTADLVVACGQDAWVGYARDDGREVFRTRVPLDRMVPLGRALYGFQRHESYAAGKRTGHQPFRLDLATGELVALPPPTPPGATDADGWLASFTLVPGGLLCTFDHGEPSSAAGADALRLASYVWNPEAGTLTPAPRVDPSMAPALHLGSTQGLVARDGRHVLWGDRGRWWVRDLGDPTAPVVASHAASDPDAPYFEPLAFDVEARLWLAGNRNRRRLLTFDGACVAELAPGGSFDARVWPSRGLTHVTRATLEGGLHWERLC